MAAGVVLQFVCVFRISSVKATPPGGKTKNSSSGSKKGSGEGEKHRSKTPRCTYAKDTPTKITWRARPLYIKKHLYLFFVLHWKKVNLNL